MQDSWERGEEGKFQVIGLLSEIAKAGGDQVCENKDPMCGFGNDVFEGLLRYLSVQVLPGGPKDKCQGVKEECEAWKRRIGQENENQQLGKQ